MADEAPQFDGNGQRISYNSSISSPVHGQGAGSVVVQINPDVQNPPVLQAHTVQESSQETINSQVRVENTSNNGEGVPSSPANVDNKDITNNLNPHAQPGKESRQPPSITGSAQKVEVVE
jgi:hypothetical protein